MVNGNHNSIVRSLVNNTNTFGIGIGFANMHDYSGLLEFDEYTIAEFLTGVKVIVGDIFRGCKVISINGKENENEIKINGHPLVYNRKTKRTKQTDDIVTFTYKRNDFAILKHKR